MCESKQNGDPSPVYDMAGNGYCKKEQYHGMLRYLHRVTKLRLAAGRLTTILNSNLKPCPRPAIGALGFVRHWD